MANVVILTCSVCLINMEERKEEREGGTLWCCGQWAPLSFVACGWAALSPISLAFVRINDLNNFFLDFTTLILRTKRDGRQMFQATHIHLLRWGHGCHLNSLSLPVWCLHMSHNITPTWEGFRIPGWGRWASRTDTKNPIFRIWGIPWYSKYGTCQMTGHLNFKTFFLFLWHISSFILIEKFSIFNIAVWPQGHSAFQSFIILVNHINSQVTVWIGRKRKQRNTKHTCIWHWSI